ncbi:spr1629 family repressor/antitoxin [Virgibacillus siamensis]|uniref:spr1629 family repressor/antitoxin n=1 Tax=Virgibacillus siamensis TaxID=480071 RepID=UPI0009847806|nr:XRE family transcriptional regulator [Virgibacillus siamensis]
MFIGENLTNLRIMHGYSRKQLSEILGITEQAVWQYENQYTSPKMKIVNDLKSIFNVKSRYFYKKDVLSRYVKAENIPLMNIAYRSKVINVISKTQSEAKHVQFLDSFVNYFAAKINFPTQKIIQLRNNVIEFLNTADQDRQTQITHVAKMARHALDLDENTNDELMFAMEKSGIFIFEKAIGEEIDAYSLWTKQERPFIILGNLKRSAVRRNFDLAHELGHLLLHYRVEFTNLDRNEHKAFEKEANQFAGAFLLPEKAFLTDLQTVERITNPDAYIDLKKKWKTSLQVLGYRAANLGILDEKNHRNFYAALHRKGYLKREPMDETISIQRPQKMKSIMDLGFKKRIFNLQQMLNNDWMADVQFLHQITGIDANFFDRYMMKKKDFELTHVSESHTSYSTK